MKVLLLPMLAGLMLPAPAWAADAPATETELHIEAIGSVIADSAIYSTTYNVAEHGKAACEATLAESITRTQARLQAAGLPSGAVTLTPSACAQTDDADGAPNSFGFYQAARKPGTGVPLIQTVDLAGGTETAQAPSPEAGNAAAAAALAANTAGKKARIDAERARMSTPVFTAKVTVSAKVDDMSKLPAIQRIFTFQYGSNAAHTEYQFAHPNDVHGTALANGLAKARKEGDLFAHYLGCHIVRIARVSNHAGSPSLSDIVNLFGQLKGTELEWTIPATRSVSVAIDYVMAPN